jgi:hypothetical protein
MKSVNILKFSRFHIDRTDDDVLFINKQNNDGFLLL